MLQSTVQVLQPPERHCLKKKMKMVQLQEGYILWRSLQRQSLLIQLDHSMFLDWHQNEWLVGLRMTMD